MVFGIAMREHSENADCGTLEAFIAATGPLGRYLKHFFEPEQLANNPPRALSLRNPRITGLPLGL